MTTSEPFGAFEPWITEPGVYDMDDTDYHRDPVVGGSLSSTGARRLLAPSCPAKYRWYADHPEIKQEYDFGHAAHRAVLGIGAEIAVLDYDNWKKPAARDERDAIRDAGMVPLLQKEADIVTAMADAIRTHSVAGRLFRPERGTAEKVVVWRDRATGVMRRARLDWVQGHVIVDYKTCEHADPAACMRAIFAYGYHQQADFYLDGATEVPGVIPAGKKAQFLFVFQEKNPPYLVTVVEPDAEQLLWGDVLNRKAIDVYRRCVETDTWPGWSIPGQTSTTDTDIALIGLPPYALTAYERARERGDYDVPVVSHAR